MKKIFIVAILLIFSPLLILNIIVKDSNKKEDIHETVIRVKHDDFIEKIKLEDYIVGVVAAEMPTQFEEEALKAQAVASRSYALKKINQNKNNEYDVTDTISDQVYYTTDEMKEKWKDNYIKYYNKIKDVVNATKGEYLTYNDELIEALFFSTSFGNTENSESVFKNRLPYLRSVESKWDEQISPVFNSKNNFTLFEFYTNLGLSYSENLDINIISKNKSGSIKVVEINGVKFSGTDIRSKLNLKSTNFDIKRINDFVEIDVKGYGHGVGMSQYGAQGMAKEGFDYKEILKYYYNGIEIKKI